MGKVIKGRLQVNSRYWLETSYDHHQRSWVIQIKDSANTRVGEAYFCGHYKRVERAQAFMAAQVGVISYTTEGEIV